MGGVLKAVFDPAGITDGLADNGSPYEAQPQAPRVDIGFNPLGYSGLGQYVNSINDSRTKLENKKRMDGFISSMASGPEGKSIARAIHPTNAEAKPADWSAQWRYTPGQGPQWFEPKRVSPNNDVPWAPQLNAGPAKGNRF